MPKAPQSDQLLAVVASDLAYLSANWGLTVDDDTLRRGSVTLRMLLLDGLLQRAWNEVGRKGEPTIIAPDLEAVLALRARSDIRHALAGGGAYEGLQARLALLERGSTPTDPPFGRGERYFGLRKFVNSCGLVLEWRRVRRREIISYVANKLGGAHLELNRSPGSIYSHLDQHAGSFDVHGKNAIYFELLSIGQLVSEAPDIGALLEEINGGVLSPSRSPG